jgi:hypothetical protein
MGVKQIGWQSIVRVKLAESRDKRRILVNKMTKFQIP